MTYSFLIALAIVYIFPFVIAIVTSFKTEPNATADPLSLVPHPVDDDRVPRPLHGSGLPPVGEELA